MTETASLIVVVTDNFSQAERLRGILTADRYRVLTVADLETAEMRIAGGGVDLVVMRLSPDLQGTRIREAIASLKKRTAELPVVLLCDSDRALTQVSLIAGMPPVVQEADLLPTVRTLIERQRSLPEKSGPDGPTRIISLQGAKGGVGASTVALNLAALLARQGKTILAEMRPGLGTLTSHFRLRRKSRTLADLMATGADAITAADVEDCLWPCQEIPGLSILFGPHSFERDFDWPARISKILRIAAGNADYVVVDLPHCFSDVNRTVLRATDYFLLVLERDALCLRAGKLMFEAIDSENLLPHSTAAVVVARASLAAPLDLSEVERELNIPSWAFVPPDPDLCLRAYQAQTAVVSLDPESILADSYVRLVAALPAALRAGRPQLV